MVSNNFFSADLLGIVPGSVVGEVELPDNDRIIPRLLRDQAGLENRALGAVGVMADLPQFTPPGGAVHVFKLP